MCAMHLYCVYNYNILHTYIYIYVYTHICILQCNVIHSCAHDNATHLLLIISTLLDWYLQVFEASLQLSCFTFILTVHRSYLDLIWCTHLLLIISSFLDQYLQVFKGSLQLSCFTFILILRCSYASLIICITTLIWVGQWRIHLYNGCIMHWQYISRNTAMKISCFIVMMCAIISPLL